MGSVAEIGYISRKMASNPPGKCCVKGFVHEGKAVGTYEQVFGLDTYVTGTSNSPNDKVIVILTDIYGNRLINTLLNADQFAAAGYRVYIPDLFDGDYADINDQDRVKLPEWFKRHTPEITKPISDAFVRSIRKEFNPKFLAVVGYCFGAKYAIHQIAAADGVADCCAVAHPSLVTIEEVAAISKDKPILISAAETDPIFPPELRAQTEAKLKEIGARYQVDLFSGVSHGFSVRGDITNPVVKYAKEKAFCDQVYWFDYFANGGK